MGKAGETWDAASKGVQEYGKSEAALKLILDDVKKSTNERAGAATDLMDVMAMSGMVAVNEATAAK